MQAQAQASGAIIFDLDGVIIDSEGLQYEAYRQVLAGFGIEVSRDEYARQWIAAGNGPEYAVDRYHPPATADDLRRLKNPIYLELLRSRVTLMPGVRDALSRLGDEYPLALATNSGEVDTGFVLERFDLRRCFSAVITREKYPRPKPAPDAFLAAVAALDRPPHRCVVIEDAYKGVVAAAQAGCPCIAVPHDLTKGNDFGGAGAIVSSLDQVTVGLVGALLDAARPAPA